MNIDEGQVNEGVTYVLDFLQAHRKLMSLKRGEKVALGQNGELIDLDTESYVTEFYLTCGKLTELGCLCTKA